MTGTCRLARRFTVNRRKSAIAAVLFATSSIAFASGKSGGPSADASAISTAALHFLGAPKAVGIPRIAPPFATVSYDGGIEGNRSTGQFLFRKFSFGWQLIRVGDALRPCDLRGDGVPERTALRLVEARDASKSRVATACPVPLDAYEPSQKETAVRSVLQAHLHNSQAVPKVSVVGDYAIAEWYGNGGGEWAFAHRRGGWTTLMHGGGSMGACDLVRRGVPPASARALMRAFDSHDDDANRFSSVAACENGASPKPI